MAKRGSVKDLLERTKNGEALAASRLMSKIQWDNKTAKRMVSKLTLPDKTLLIGVTGSGGVGKSTLINKLIHYFLKEQKSIGILCCDPVSISDGSFLGDRIRMQEHAGKEQVFIRSLTQRQNFKGASPEISYLIKIFGAMGKDVIIVETVGSGQENLGFREQVRALIYVTSPDIGDEIQLFKGGVIETADIIVLNRSDSPKADQAFQDLTTHFGQSKKLYKVNSLNGDGFPELMQGIKEVKF
ncbi:MAG: hypothetical protein HYV47_01375 [Candidatus Nealsonbacteria bacterium]|nr:hypothetical protein [Candidatus Nealsonbacteria bacterium]